LDFGRWVMEQSAFVEGRFDTGFITQYFRGAESLDTPLPPWESTASGSPLSLSEEIAIAAAVLQHQSSSHGLPSTPVQSQLNPAPGASDAWQRLWNP